MLLWLPDNLSWSSACCDVVLWLCQNSTCALAFSEGKWALSCFSRMEVCVAYVVGGDGNYWPCMIVELGEQLVLFWAQDLVGYSSKSKWLPGAYRHYYGAVGVDNWEGQGTSMSLNHKMSGIDLGFWVHLGSLQIHQTCQPNNSSSERTHTNSCFNLYDNMLNI